MAAGAYVKRAFWHTVTWHLPGLPFWVTAGLALFALLPILSLAMAWVSTPPEDWQPFKPQVRMLASHSLGLLVGVALASGFVGTGLAWLTTLCDFPGRRFFSWALLLPLAIPAYVQGFVLLDLLDILDPAPPSCGPSWSKRDLFHNPSVGELILSLSLSFYPYVYLAARHGFQTRSAWAMEAARSLGSGPVGAFFRAGLPVAVPWISLSLAWVALETLADLGTVSMFRYETLTTALYQAWAGSSALPTVERLAGLLLILATGLVFLGLYQGRHLRHYPSTGSGTAQPTLLPYLTGLCASACAALVFAMAFVLPLACLLIWMPLHWDGSMTEPAVRSLLTALAGADLITAAALFVSLAKRKHPSEGMAWLIRTATLGYFLPGAAWAVGIEGLATGFDNGFIEFCARLSLSVPPLLGGGIGLLLLAYLIRFVGLAHVLTGRAVSRVTPNMEEGARLLAVSGLPLWRRVYFPLLWQDLLGAFLLAFAVLSQELPLTLLLRPPGFETLSTYLFAMTHQGYWEMADQAALPALALGLVLAGLPGVYVLIRTGAFRHG